MLASGFHADTKVLTGGNLEDTAGTGEVASGSATLATSNLSPIMVHRFLLDAWLPTALRRTRLHNRIQDFMRHEHREGLQTDEGKEKLLHHRSAAILWAAATIIAITYAKKGRKDFAAAKVIF
jgi:hypothetical protein